MSASHVPAPAPKTAVIGAGGFLGARFLAALRRSFPDAAATARTPGSPGLLPLELAAPDVRKLRLAATGHRAAIICAGVGSIVRCEREPEATRAANVDGTLALADQLLAEGVLPVFLSTDFVFGGDRAPYDDDDRPAPLNEYGRQKAEVEERLRELAPGDHLTLRLSKVFALERGSGTLLDDMARRLLAGEFPAAADQWFCPTLADDVVSAALLLLARGVRGTVNLCNPEGWSWHGLATALAGALALPPERVRSISIDELGGGVRRPHDIRMRPARLAAETGFPFRPTAACIARTAAGWLPAA
jgi:dTDP-4-dehydrorhamnose reductase